MNKEKFLRVISALKEQRSIDKEFSDNMGKCFPEVYSYLLYPKNNLTDFIINEYDKDGWLDWFVYELDFGEKVGKAKVNGNDVEITTAEQLYDFIYEKNT